MTNSLVLPLMIAIAIVQSGEVEGSSVCTTTQPQSAIQKQVLLPTLLPQFVLLNSYDLTQLSKYNLRQLGMDSNIFHFYSGQNALTGFLIDERARSTRFAEQSSMFRMESFSGQAGDVATYKMALGSETNCGLGSSPCWGGTIVGGFLPGYSSRNSQITLEIDHNNQSMYNCVDGDEGRGNIPACDALVITGASRFQYRSNIAIGGYNQARSGIQWNSGGVIGNDMISYDNAVNLIVDNGHHPGNGIVAAKATYGGDFIIGPKSRFIVSRDGSVKAVSMKLMNFTVATLPQCDASVEGTISYISDAKNLSYGGFPDGGGDIGTTVVCSRSGKSATFGWTMH